MDLVREEARALADIGCEYIQKLRRVAEAAHEIWGQPSPLRGGCAEMNGSNEGWPQRR